MSIQSDRDLDVLPTEDVVAEGVEAAKEALLGRVDLIEQIPAQQQEINVLLLGLLQQLLKGIERVILPDWVFLLVAEMDIGGHQKPDFPALHNKYTTNLPT